MPEGSRIGVGRPGPAGEQRVVLGQNGRVEQFEVLARFQPHVGDLDRASDAVDVERLRGTAASVERQHQLTAEAFAQRVLVDEPADLPDQPAMPAEPQVEINALLQYAKAFLVEPDGLAA